MNKTTANNDNNTFYKTTMVDGIETPYPPSAPAYCTRSSLKDVEEASKTLTEQELQKLVVHTTAPTLMQRSPEVQCVPAVAFNPDMHRIMCRYADKQQQLCSQICELNQRLQAKHDENIQLKEEYQQQLKTVEDELCHITEINDGNEDEVNTLQEKNDELCTDIAVIKKKYADTQHWHPFYVLFGIMLYTFALFYANHTMNWEMTSQYAVVHNTTSIIFGQIQETCSWTDSQPVLHG